MTHQELQDYINIYCLISFNDGRKEPGIILSKYDNVTGKIEYFFVPQENMGAYKAVFEINDKERCAAFCEKIFIANINNIRPVSLADNKIIMQLLEERKQILNG